MPKYEKVINSVQQVLKICTSKQKYCKSIRNMKVLGMCKESIRKTQGYWQESPGKLTRNYFERTYSTLCKLWTLQLTSKTKYINKITKLDFFIFVQCAQQQLAARQWAGLNAPQQPWPKFTGGLSQYLANLLYQY